MTRVGSFLAGVVASTGLFWMFRSMMQQDTATLKENLHTTRQALSDVLHNSVRLLAPAECLYTQIVSHLVSL